LLEVAQRKLDEQSSGVARIMTTAVSTLARLEVELDLINSSDGD
jgi:hypothetical protein